MQLLVCVKQVLSKDGLIEIDQSGTTVLPGRSPLYQLNSYDEYALETAMQIRETIPGTRVDVLSLGPPRTEAVIRRGLGMGGDHGIHLLVEGEMPLDPFQVSSRIVAAIRERSYDLILTGFLAEDDQEGQVGPLIAESLGWPCAVSVLSLQIFPQESRACLEAEAEGGIRERWQVPLPAVCTVQSGMDKPRYPSLSNVLRARKQVLEVLREANASLPAPLRKIARYTYPEKLREGLVLTGTPQEKSKRLASLLREKGFLD